MTKKSETSDEEMDTCGQHQQHGRYAHVLADLIGQLANRVSRRPCWKG